MLPLKIRFSSTNINLSGQYINWTYYISTAPPFQHFPDTAKPLNSAHDLGPTQILHLILTLSLSLHQTLDQLFLLPQFAPKILLHTLKIIPVNPSLLPHLIFFLYIFLWLLFPLLIKPMCYIFLPQLNRPPTKLLAPNNVRLKALAANNTSSIDKKWVFKIMRKSDGTIE